MPEAGQSRAKTAAALPVDADGWASFFAGYGDIVLVANSDKVDMAALCAQFGPGALFVFFNKVYKVLSAPFGGAALLVARSSEAGANIVYRREVETVVGYFRPPGFTGILNLKAAASERFSGADEFAGSAAGFLDLSRHFEGFYPRGRLPSSGFALALWLAEQRLPGRISLVGFSGQRSQDWKLFRIHDWTFEQTVQRLLAQTGRISLVGDEAPEGDLARIARRFPEIAAQDIVLVASDVLAGRLNEADTAIDGLLSVTRWQRVLRRNLLLLKPKTRKQKLADARASTESGPGAT
ncbi:3-deoxy-manno-octulosonate cytidylyltransferase [Aureimonas sp. SA4125]|uniref:3-deoxy-manno-octulosonate cytidylyltransferase n=1 Tax=Aureimonas sp. SA4125 TaxID=2826993 RepID=UPI001CC59E01|nr:3-deoxy-manno-octulosonate cytidylyltransferase [Aureimonas sp. SA4125]BDA84816.1 3-deoxy-manno-octulosonate cytidylyltransferase [Aureimonas sp. SA4125]